MRRQYENESTNQKTVLVSAYICPLDTGCAKSFLHHDSFLAHALPQYLEHAFQVFQNCQAKVESTLLTVLSRLHTTHKPPIHLKLFKHKTKKRKKDEKKRQKKGKERKKKIKEKKEIKKDKIKERKKKQKKIKRNDLVFA